MISFNLGQNASMWSILHKPQKLQPRILALIGMLPSFAEGE
jgi:hypothetical protein